VVLIGEHGEYPADELGRHMYPRKHLFEQIAGVFAQSGRSVPVRHHAPNYMAWPFLLTLVSQTDGPSSLSAS